MMKIKYISRIKLSACLYMLIFCLCLSCSSKNHEASSNISFDSLKWKQGNDEIRGAMVKDLIDKKILIDKNKNEIDDLIGQPDEIREREYIYFLETDFMGPWRMFLHVQFNELNTVSSVWMND